MHLNMGLAGIDHTPQIRQHAAFEIGDLESLGESRTPWRGSVEVEIPRRLGYKHVGWRTRLAVKLLSLERTQPRKRLFQIRRGLFTGRLIARVYVDEDNPDMICMFG